MSAELQEIFTEVNAGLLETQAQIEDRTQPALSDETISLRIERDETNRLWRAQVPGIGQVGEASTLPNLLRLLADYLPRIGDAHGRDWHGYVETLPCQMRGDYW